MNVPVICDYGSGFSKVGFSGVAAPLAIFPTVLGKLRHDEPLVGLDEADWFLGEEVQSRREKLNLLYPISRATVTNWENLEKIWHHAFYQVLRVAPEQHPLLLTDPPLNAMSSKEKVSQILFETFDVPALHLANQGALSLFASGLTSGTILESGEGMTHFVPILEGCPLRQSTMQTDVAGQDITSYLLQLLSAKGNTLVGKGDGDYIWDLKEKCCYVALDFDKEKGEAPVSPDAQTFQLPEGREVELGQERFLGPEVLFQTNLIGRNSLGAHVTAFRSIRSCAPDLWKVLFSRIVLSGGTGSCSGLSFRMQKELSALVSPTLVVKVASSPFSTYSAWVGGSILSSLSTFKDMWVTSKDYEEVGASAVSRRVF